MGCAIFEINMAGREMEEVKSTCIKGREAEEIAIAYLTGEGLTLLDKNWRWRRREIDIVMKSVQKGSNLCRLHVVEVRSLYQPCLKLPYETVDLKKQRSLIRAAEGYIRCRNIGYETQFDVVSIVFATSGEYTVDYFPNAFTPLW